MKAEEAIIRMERMRLELLIFDSRKALNELQNRCKHPDQYRTHNMDLVCRDCGRRT